MNVNALIGNSLEEFMQTFDLTQSQMVHQHDSNVNSSSMQVGNLNFPLQLMSMSGDVFASNLNKPFQGHNPVALFNQQSPHQGPSHHQGFSHQLNASGPSGELQYNQFQHQTQPPVRGLDNGGFGFGNLGFLPPNNALGLDCQDGLWSSLNPNVLGHGAIQPPMSVTSSGTYGNGVGPFGATANMAHLAPPLLQMPLTRDSSFINGVNMFPNYPSLQHGPPRISGRVPTGRQPFLVSSSPYRREQNSGHRNLNPYGTMLPISGSTPLLNMHQDLRLETLYPRLSSSRGALSSPSSSISFPSPGLLATPPSGDLRMVGLFSTGLPTPCSLSTSSSRGLSPIEGLEPQPSVSHSRDQLQPSQFTWMPPVVAPPGPFDSQMSFNCVDESLEQAPFQRGIHPQHSSAVSSSSNAPSESASSSRNGKKKTRARKPYDNPSSSRGPFPSCINLRERLIILCQWDTCEEVCNGLDGFAKHIEKAHSVLKGHSSPRTRTCLWRGCGEPHIHSDGNLRRHLERETNVAVRCTKCNVIVGRPEMSDLRKHLRKCYVNQRPPTGLITWKEVDKRPQSEEDLEDPEQ